MTLLAVVLWCRLVTSSSAAETIVSLVYCFETVAYFTDPFFGITTKLKRLLNYIFTYFPPNTDLTFLLFGQLCFSFQIESIDSLLPGSFIHSHFHLLFRRATGRQTPMQPSPAPTGCRTNPRASANGGRSSGSGWSCWVRSRLHVTC